MRIALALAILLAASFISPPAQAQCNAQCQDACKRTAHLGGLTVDQCIAKWAKINADRAAAQKKTAGSQSTATKTK